MRHYKDSEGHEFLPKFLYEVE